MIITTGHQAKSLLLIFEGFSCDGDSVIQSRLPSVHTIAFCLGEKSGIFEDSSQTVPKQFPHLQMADDFITLKLGLCTSLLDTKRL